MGPGTYEGILFWILIIVGFVIYHKVFKIASDVKEIKEMLQTQHNDNDKEI